MFSFIVSRNALHARSSLAWLLLVYAAICKNILIDFLCIRRNADAH